MAVGRISAVRLLAPTASKGRVSAVRLAGTAVAGSKGRVSAVRLLGTPFAGRKGRVSAVRLVGSPGIVVAPIATQTVEPLTYAQVAIVMQTGTANGYVYRIVSAPAGVTVLLEGTGATRRFKTPGRLAGGTIILGVRAKLGTVESPEVLATFVVRPQVSWNRFNDGRGWRPVKD